LLNELNSISRRWRRRRRRNSVLLHSSVEETVFGGVSEGAVWRKGGEETRGDRNTRRG